MITNCKESISDKERLHWSQQSSEAKVIMYQYGEIPDETLDTMNIANNIRTNKDNLIIPRRRMIILTNNNFLQKEWVKIEEKRKIEEALATAKKKKKKG